MSSSLPSSAPAEVFGPPFEWWRQAVADRQGRLPSRGDLRPEDHLGPGPMPYIILVDVQDGGKNLRFRLMGTHHVKFNERDLTGLAFDTVFGAGPIYDYVRGLYDVLVRERRPIWTVNRVPHPRGGPDLMLRRLMLPLAGNGLDVDMCLGVQKFDYPAFAEPQVVHVWHNGRSVRELERILL